MKLSTKKSGFVSMPIIVAIISLVLAVGLSVSVSTFNQSSSSQEVAKSVKTFSYLYAGFEDGLRQIAINPDITTTSDTDCGTLADDCYFIDMVANGCSTNEGCARVKIESATSPKTLRVEGRHKDVIRTVKAIVTLDSNNSEITDISWEEAPRIPLDLYWIGNAGDWNDSAHFSLTSGGSASTYTPDENTNVKVDANSFNTGGSITIGDANAIPKVRNLDFTGLDQVIDLLKGNNDFHIYGSLTYVLNVNPAYDTNLTFAGSSAGMTITTAGNSFRNDRIIFNGAGGEWLLQDDLTHNYVLDVPDRIDLMNGELNTNNKTVSCRRFKSSNTNARKLILGSSSVTCASGDFQTSNGWSYTWDFNDITNLTFTAGTSTITISANSASFRGGGLTYYNVSLTGTPITVSGNNTFSNNLTISAGKTVNFTAGSTQTIGSGLTLNGTSGSVITLRSTSAGTQWNLAIPGNKTASYVDVKDSNVTGGTITCTNCTNSGNNSGWSFQ